MIFRELGNTGVYLSVIGLGGHEYFDNGKIRGFNEDSEKAIKPGYIFDGFGGKKRKSILKTAFEYKINFLDVTIDSEKEALGRNLEEIKPDYKVFIQTRPSGMVYHYDKNNTKMANYNTLKKEVVRIIKLMKINQLDFLNFAFMQSAIDNDPDYLKKINYNINKLKEENLIKFACADTFSGEKTYLTQIEKGCFDAIYINFSFADYAALNEVFPAARENNMGIISREAFMKGKLFKMGKKAGIKDKNLLAQTSLKWNINQPGMTTVLVGVDNSKQLKTNLKILDNTELSSKDKEIIEKLKSTSIYKSYAKKRLNSFL